MKFALVAATFIAAVAAGPREDIPACALPCLDKALEANGCKNDDYACACKNFSKIQVDAAGCVITACPDISKVIDAASKVCKNLPAPSSAAPSSAAPSSAAPSSAAPSSAAPSSAAPSKPATSAAPSKPATDCVTSVVTKPTGNSTTPAPTSPPVTAGAAGVSVGALAMLAVAALAL